MASGNPGATPCCWAGASRQLPALVSGRVSPSRVRRNRGALPMNWTQVTVGLDRVDASRRYE